jgi:hypothetical protein
VYRLFHGWSFVYHNVGFQCLIQQYVLPWLYI